MKAKLVREDIILKVSSGEADRITCANLRSVIRLCEWELRQVAIHPDDHAQAQQAIEAAKFLMEYFGEYCDQ